MTARTRRPGIRCNRSRARCCRELLRLPHSAFPQRSQRRSATGARRVRAFLDSDDQCSRPKRSGRSRVSGSPERGWSYTGLYPHRRRRRTRGGAGTITCTAPRAILEQLLMNAVTSGLRRGRRARLLAAGRRLHEQLPVFEDYDFGCGSPPERHRSHRPSRFICVRFHDQHYRPGAGAASMATSRLPVAAGAAGLADGSAAARARRRAQARSALDLASLYVETDRRAARALVNLRTLVALPAVVGRAAAVLLKTARPPLCD